MKSPWGKLEGRACRSLRADDGLLFPYRIGEELPTKRPLCETWARMSHPDPNGAPDRRPIKVGEVWENPVTGERSVILERPWDNPASRVTGELTALVGARVMGGTPPSCSCGAIRRAGADLMHLVDEMGFEPTTSSLRTVGKIS